MPSAWVVSVYFDDKAEAERVYPAVETLIHLMDEDGLVSMHPDKSILLETLLWLRNHYDVGKPELKQRILERVDRVLDRFDPVGRISGRRYPDGR